MGVPYVIVKGKARLGTVVHKKTAAVLALQDVKSEDTRELATIVSAAKANLCVVSSLSIAGFLHLLPARTSTTSTAVNGVEVSAATSRPRCYASAQRRPARPSLLPPLASSELLSLVGSGCRRVASGWGWLSYACISYAIMPYIHAGCPPWLG
jgi:hypothetical protein